MLVQTLPPAPPAIVAPVAEASRDEFPKCRASGGGGPVVYTCPKPQTRLYWVTLERPTVDPEHGPMVEEVTVDAEITAGYIPGEGGEIKRLTALVAADMPGWEIIGLSLADDPGTEF